MDARAFSPFATQSERGPMRLTAEQVETIRQRIQRHIGPHARIWLFGSRVDDSRRGGDVDLYVEPETPPDLVARLRCKSALADALDLNVGLIVQQPGRPDFRVRPMNSNLLTPLRGVYTLRASSSLGRKRSGPRT